MFDSVLVYLTKTKRFQKCFSSGTSIHKKTLQSSSCIPKCNQNYNELKIKNKIYFTVLLLSSLRTY